MSPGIIPPSPAEIKARKEMPAAQRIYTHRKFLERRSVSLEISMRVYRGMGQKPDSNSSLKQWSGRVDLNHRPPGPEPGALARLRYAPKF